MNDTYVSVPEAFAAAPAGLRDALKLKFGIEFAEGSRSPLGLREVFFTDRVLVDFGAVGLDALDARKVLKDCELVRERLASSPESFRDIVDALRRADVKNAEAAARKLRLTEEDSVRAGGGIVGLLLLAAAVLVAGGCGTTMARRPASDPKAGPK